jgi:hypothetical protein
LEWEWNDFMALLAVGFVVGIAAGYGIRELISRRRHNLARRGAIHRKYPL